jgi:hypothetical protein
MVSTLSGENLSLNLRVSEERSSGQLSSLLRSPQTRNAPGDRVGKTKLHGGDVLGVDITKQSRQLSPDSTVQIVDGGIGNDGEFELLGNGSTELGLGNDELLVLVLLVGGDLLGEELLERLGHLALADGGHVLDGVGGRGEAVDGLELETIVGVERESADDTAPKRCDVLTTEKQSRSVMRR